MTLANYLREIRATAFPYPKLGRSAINAADHEQVDKWLIERKQHPGKNADLAGMKKALSLFDSRMKPVTQREIAERAGVSLFLVNKVFTSGKKIRGSGLKNILRAMGCEPGSVQTRKALSIWASESGMAVDPDDVDDLVSEKNVELAAWWRRVSPIIIKMDSHQRNQLALAVSRPSVMAALPSLNAVFDSSQR
jgi:hypothetical protein